MVICRSADNKFHCVTKRHHDIVPGWHVIWGIGGQRLRPPCRTSASPSWHKRHRIWQLVAVSPPCVEEKRSLHVSFHTVYCQHAVSVSVWFICWAQQRSSVLWQIGRRYISPEVARSLMECHVGWCNAETLQKLSAHQLEWGQKKEGETGWRESEQERERDRRRLKGPDYCISSRIQLVLSKSPVRSPYCWRMITEIKGQFVLGLS